MPVMRGALLIRSQGRFSALDAYNRPQESISEPRPPEARVIAKDGTWQVSPLARPAGWQKLGLQDPWKSKEIPHRRANGDGDRSRIASGGIDGSGLEPSRNDVKSPSIPSPGSNSKRASDHAQNLQLHHLSYVNVGQERQCDVQVLCPVCHEQNHPRSSQRAAKRPARDGVPSSDGGRKPPRQPARGQRPPQQWNLPQGEAAFWDSLLALDGV